MKCDEMAWDWHIVLYQPWGVSFERCRNEEVVLPYPLSLYLTGCLFPYF